MQRPLKAVHICTRPFCLNFLKWDSDSGKIKANHGWTPKITIALLVLALANWIYFEDWNADIDDEMARSKMIVMFEIVGTLILLLFTWLNFYFLQNVHAQLFNSCIELDELLESLHINTSKRLFSKLSIVVVTTLLTNDVLQFVAFWYLYVSDLKLISTKILPLIVGCNTMALILFELWFLLDRFSLLNEVLVRLVGAERKIHCPHCRKYVRRIDFTKLCTVHVLRCTSVIYDKMVEVYVNYQRINGVVILSLNLITLIELTFQCYVYIRIAFMDGTYSWKSIAVNIDLMCCTVILGWLLGFLCDKIKSQRCTMIRIIAKTYMKSSSKLTIQEDIGATVSHIRNKPMKFSLYGLYEVKLAAYLQYVNAILIYSCLLLNLNKMT